MPILAGLMLSCLNGLVAVFAKIMVVDSAITWARVTFFLALIAAFFTATGVCFGWLVSGVQGAAVPSRFLQGLGMFIPSNAGAVLACIGSVWLACILFSIKVQTLRMSAGRALM